jgi:hypothetical protein
VSLRWCERPTSAQHFHDGWGLARTFRDNHIVIVLASVVWNLWKTRNNWVFNNHLIKSPKAIAYKVLGFLTQYKRLLKPKESLEMEDTIKKLQEGSKMW